MEEAVFFEVVNGEVECVEKVKLGTRKAERGAHWRLEAGTKRTQLACVVCMHFSKIGLDDDTRSLTPTRDWPTQPQPAATVSK